MTAKLFKNGSSQAVRLPKEFRFEGDEVCIDKIGDTVLLSPKDKSWDRFMRGVNGFSEDFEIDRSNEPPDNDDKLIFD